MDMDNQAIERREAIIAGEKALQSLYQVKDQLDNARGWGILDIFGGGAFTTFIKHTKINKASMLCSQAKRDIMIFERELRDVTFINNDLNVNIDILLTLFDFSSNDLFADVLVQMEINKARSYVDNAINTIKSIVNELKLQ